MIAFPGGVRVWLATGHIDMREGFDGLSLLVQETLIRRAGGFLTSMVEVVGVLVAHRDGEGARSDHVSQRVRDPHRIAPVGYKAAQPRGDPKPSLAQAVARPWPAVSRRRPRSAARRRNQL